MLHLGLLQHGLSLRRLLLPLLLQVRILALATYNARVCLGTILKRADRAHPWLRTATNRGLTWATATNMTRACIATALAFTLVSAAVHLGRWPHWRAVNTPQLWRAIIWTVLLFYPTVCEKRARRQHTNNLLQYDKCPAISFSI